MIYETTMYAAECDKCKCGWESYQGYSAMHTKQDVVYAMEDQEWIFGDHLDDTEQLKEHAGKVYCPECAYIDSEDKLQFKTDLETITL